MAYSSTPVPEGEYNMMDLCREHSLCLFSSCGDFLEDAAGVFLQTSPPSSISKAFHSSAVICNIALSFNVANCQVTSVENLN